MKSDLSVFYKGGVEAGEPYAMWKLGQCYASGHFVRIDVLEGMALYEKASELGFAPAGRDLGLMHLYGAVPVGSVEKAMEYLKKAANQGDAEAQFQWDRLKFCVWPKIT